MKNQLTLGQLIFLLSRCNPDAEVRYDFCDLVPTKIDSYRGFYEQLAIGWAQDGKMTVDELLKRLREKLGGSVEGWKGGTYDIYETTEMWVANRGECHGTTIVGVLDSDSQVVLETGYLN